MIKYFCDRCGKECKAESKIIPKYVARGGKCNTVLMVFGNGMLCEECAKKFEQVKDQFKHEEDIFNMTDEDIELLRYTFKVGDKVIESDGLTGTVKEVCTCSECKRRGFYELTVEMEDGSIDYVMATDKKRGFDSYYSIGDRVFGNLKEEYVSKEIDKCEKQMWQLYKQLGTIQEVKMLHQHKKKENNNGN